VSTRDQKIVSFWRPVHLPFDDLQNFSPAIGVTNIANFGLGRIEARRSRQIDEITFARRDSSAIAGHTEFLTSVRLQENPSR